MDVKVGFYRPPVSILFVFVSWISISLWESQAHFVHYETRAPVNRSLLEKATKALTESPIVSLKSLKKIQSYNGEVSRARIKKTDH